MPIKRTDLFLYFVAVPVSTSHPTIATEFRCKKDGIKDVIEVELPGSHGWLFLRSLFFGQFEGFEKGLFVLLNSLRACAQRHHIRFQVGILL